MTALRLLKRHSMTMQAYFEYVLVLTYAFPDTILRPLMPPGLVLDTYENYGFLAIAMVQTRNMRPRFMPTLIGRDFFLTGYRLFTRYRTRSGKQLLCLRILPTDTKSVSKERGGKTQ